MITFEQARDLVQDYYQDDWPADADFTTAPWGLEADDYYVVTAGPYARLHGARFAEEEKWEEPTLDAGNICVNKTTGAITKKYDIPDTAVPCGAPHPDDAYE